MSRRTRIALAAVVAALGLAVAAPPATAGTLDQQQTTFDNASGIDGPGPPGGPEGFSVAQTFTAGLSGWLDQVDLLLARFASTNGPLTVEIRNVSGSVPGSVVLTSASVPAADVPVEQPGLAGFEFVEVSFASPVPVVAGGEYAIVAYTGGSDHYGWGMRTVDVYVGGAAFASLASPPTTTWVSFDTPVDLAFKTYVLLPPTTKGQCKKGGWRDFEVFKNQGDCVSWVATGGKNPPSGIQTASVGVTTGKGVARARKNL
jgi:hypothetical protein